MLIRQLDPCLNELQTCAHLNSCLAIEWPVFEPTVEMAQFTALVHLIEALLLIVEGQCTVIGDSPGYERMQQAAHLLAHTGRLAEGNLLTVQCLVLKALYLLHAQETTASYSAISEAVRTSFLLGLHTGQHDYELSPFEIHMHQRVFWSVYCLDRIISQICGLPYAMQDSDVHIDIPAALDDKALGGSEQLPDEMPHLSPIPYLCNTIQWARMSAEVWNKVSSANGKGAVNEDFLVTMDARLQNFDKRLPDMLRWPLLDLRLPDQRPSFVEHQAMVLHLVS